MKRFLSTILCLAIVISASNFGKMQVQAADMNVSSVCSVGSVLAAGDRITFESVDYGECAFEYFVPKYMGDMSTNYYHNPCNSYKKYALKYSSIFPFRSELIL